MTLWGTDAHERKVVIKENNATDGVLFSSDSRCGVWGLGLGG
jgi:hypothetical protein